jgi:hypothetical protein
MGSQSIINVKDYGASGKEYGGDVLAAFNAALNDVPEGGTFFVPEGYYPLYGTFTVRKRNIFIDCRGWIVPHAGYDDYLVWLRNEITIPTAIQRGATAAMYNVQNLNIDAKFQSRGLRLYRTDCSVYNNIMVANANGTAIDCDRVLESTFIKPRIIGAKNRQRFSTPDDWNSGTAYSVGQRVKLAPSAYSGATSYTYNSVVRNSDGFDYLSIAVTHSGNAPESSPAFWRRIPFECFECILANTNQDPNTQNSNNATSGNRYWLKVYQEEPALKINDDIQDVTDRSNQITFIDCDIRDWTNKIGILIDNNRADSNTSGISFTNGHVHYMDSSALAGYATKGYNLELQTDTCVAQIGRAIDVNFDRTQLRATTATRAQVMRLGGRSGGTKSTQSVRCTGKLSGEGDDAVGVMCLPSCVVNGGDSVMTDFISMTGANAIDMHDPNKFFSVGLRGGIVMELPQTSGAPTAFDVSHPTSSQVNLVQYTQDGDDQPRVSLRALGALGALLFGAGGSSTLDAGLRREAADLIAMLAGDTFKVDGTWNGGLLRIGSMRVWADTTTSRLRYKWGSDPSSETDGTLI